MRLHNLEHFNTNAMKSVWKIKKMYKEFLRNETKYEEIWDFVNLNQWNGNRFR